MSRVMAIVMMGLWWERCGREAGAEAERGGPAIAGAAGVGGAGAKVGGAIPGGCDGDGGAGWDGGRCGAEREWVVVLGGTGWIVWAGRGLGLCGLNFYEM